jgi:hypothetical protein
MRIQVLPLVAVGMLAWGALASPAQEQGPRPKELPSVPETLPAPAPAPLVEDCHVPPHPVPKVLVYDRDFPVQILVPREVIQVDKVPTLVIAFKPEKRTVTDIVMKPREVSREVCYTTLEECVETDPCTGHCSTVLKPVTRTRIQKDLVFVAVPEERTVEIGVPFLRPAEELVPRKTVLLEYRTVMQRQSFAVGIPGEAAPPIRYLVPPPPEACPHDAHP